MNYIYPSRVSPLVRLNRLLGSEAYANARFFIIVDENTYSQCLTTLVSKVEALQESEFLEVPVGEDCKQLEIAQQLWQTLLESGADRNAVIVNLGGGCVSDLGGFVAAGYRRGIRCINVPTTLIGMCDAAIGGKTAVNLGGVKNQVGFFHQPEAVCIDPVFLDTLPMQELASGLFEMLKTFLLSDPEGYSELLDAMGGSNFVLDPAWITRCAQFKASVVKADPNEHGIRRMLNLGHTFGHAIEAYSHHQGKPFSHGLSVGFGMVCALYLSMRKLGFPQQEYERYRALVAHLSPLPHYTLRDTEPLLSYMRQDKKNAQGEIRCVLLQAVGEPVIDLAVDENELRDALLKI